jgi:hypothetical protein
LKKLMIAITAALAVGTAVEYLRRKQGGSQCVSHVKVSTQTARNGAKKLSFQNFPSW